MLLRAGTIPGFGDVESMSGDDVRAKINAANADFIIVSLGAAKGQAWIEHNQAHLDAPVIAHLGAVVDFVAGTISRAPALGVEIRARMGLAYCCRAVLVASVLERWNPIDRFDEPPFGAPEKGVECQSAAALNRAIVGSGVTQAGR